MESASGLNAIATPGIRDPLASPFVRITVLDVESVSTAAAYASQGSLVWIARSPLAATGTAIAVSRTLASAKRDGWVRLVALRRLASMRCVGGTENAMAVEAAHVTPGGLALTVLLRRQSA